MAGALRLPAWIAGVDLVARRRTRDVTRDFGTIVSIRVRAPGKRMVMTLLDDEFCNAGIACDDCSH
jgi:hypothetical protein